MTMKKHILPNLVLLIGGRLWLLLSITFIPFLWVLVCLDFSFTSLVLCALLTVFLVPGLCYVLPFFWNACFGEIIVTNEELIYFGLFLPTVKLKLDKIKYVDIRTFDKGNIMYPRAKGFTETNNVDMYKFILISENPLPQKRVDKINSSRKNKLIKYAVSKKLCEALDGKLPEMQARVIDYQLYLYKKAEK